VQSLVPVKIHAVMQPLRAHPNTRNVGQLAVSFGGRTGPTTRLRVRLNVVVPRDHTLGSAAQADSSPRFECSLPSVLMRPVGSHARSLKETP
jgi:hypothetical protein